MTASTGSWWARTSMVLAECVLCTYREEATQEKVRRNGQNVWFVARTLFSPLSSSFSFFSRFLGLFLLLFLFFFGLLSILVRTYFPCFWFPFFPWRSSNSSVGAHFMAFVTFLPISSGYLSTCSGHLSGCFRAMLLMMDFLKLLFVWLLGIFSLSFLVILLGSCFSCRRWFKLPILALCRLLITDFGTVPITGNSIAPKTIT